MAWFSARASAADPRLSALTRGCGFLLLLSLLFSSDLFAQRRRPVLRPVRRDYFAGKLLLIPLDSRPRSFQLPRLVAHVADHEVLTPPRGLLGDRTQPPEVDRIIAWARSINYGDLDGVIASVDLLAQGAQSSSGAASPFPETVRGLELISWIRAQRPGIPVYGFATLRQIKPALELATGGIFDYLVIGQGETTAGSLPAPERERLLSIIAARQLTGRVVISPAAEEAATMLAARQLNYRFGIAPKVVTIYSSQAERAPGEETGVPSWRQSVGSQISVIGGVELPAAAETVRRADLLLFVHTPRTGEPELGAFTEELARAVAAGYRVALADASETGASKDRLMTELRRRKLLDRLIAYAASDPARSAPALALAQASARLLIAKFLRDDLDRLARAERAQVELLLHRYADDWAYAVVVRPKLEVFVREQLRADPEQLGVALERAEDFARDELKRLVEELFQEQFRRNLHLVLMSTGEQAQFEVRSLQRFQFHLPWGRTAEAELKQGVYLPFVATLPRAGQTGRLSIDLTTPDLDERVRTRFEEMAWASFNVDAERLEVSINIKGRGEESEEYALRSRGAKGVRRIEIQAPSARGAFYALAKLEQLGAEGKLDQDLQLTESPSFKQRGIIEGFTGQPWSHRDRLDVLRFLGRVRLNRYYYAPQNGPPGRERWRESLTGDEPERLKELVRAAEENFVELVYCLSPSPSITYSSEADFASLTRQFDALAALGLRHFALLFNDLPETLAEAEDRARFPTLAAAHAHLINRAYEHLRRAAPNSSLAVAPTVYTDLYGSRDYLKELGAAIPKEIPIFWTGVDAFAPEYTDAQAREWGALVGRPPLIWDNFPANEDEAWRPYLGPKRGASPTLGEQAIGFIARPMSQAHASLPSLATTADYAWDGRGYDPERALSRALALLYDERSRAGVRIWEQVYRDYRWDNNLFEPLFWPQRGEVNLPLMEERLAQMQAALEAVGTTRERGLLRGQLAPFLALTRSGMERLKNDPAYERLANGNYCLRSDWDVIEAARDEPGTSRRTNARVAVSWSPEAIYVRVRRYDPAMRQPADGRSSIESLRLLLDTDLAGDYTASRANEDDYLITILLSQAQPVVSITHATAFRSSAPLRGIEPTGITVSQRVVEDEQDHEVEVKLPPSIFSRASFAAGFKFGLATILSVYNDASRTGITVAPRSLRVDARNPATWATVELK